MKISQPIRIIAMATVLLWATAPMAVGAEFKSQFMNESSNKVKVDILHTGGSLQKDKNIPKGESHTFNYGVQCGNTHTRRFDVWDKAGGTLGPKIGTGEFAMKAKSSGDCNAKSFTFTQCEDVNTQDNFTVDCSQVNENKGVVEIKNN